MFMIVLVTEAKIGKLVRCPSTDKSVRKTGRVNTMGFSSAVKNTIAPFSERCLQLEMIMLHKINWIQTNLTFLSYKDARHYS